MSLARLISLRPAWAALLATSMLIAPAHAGLFDAISDLTKKITDSKVKGDESRDAAYEAEMAKKFPPYQFDAPPGPQAERLVEVVRGGNFKDIKKIGIVNFSVEFALFKELRASGGGSQTGRDSEKTMKIPAPDVSKLQALVDQLHAQTAKDFAALGIEVIPFETLKATKHYVELAPAQHASPWLTDTKDSQSMFIAPSGMPLYMDNPERADFLKGLGFTFGTNTRMKEVMMTYDLKQEVHLVSVNMVVDFSAMKTSGRSLINYAAVGAANLHHLHAGNTSYRFISTTQPEFLWVRLKQPLVSDIRLVAETTVTLGESSTQQHAQIGMQTQSSSTVSATRGAGEFDLDTYYRRNDDMLNAARQMFASELARQK